MTLEIHGVVTDYWIHVKDGPGITTCGAQLQGGTGNVMPVSPPLVSRKSVSQHQKWCSCFPVVVIDLVTFTVTFTNPSNSPRKQTVK